MKCIKLEKSIFFNHFLVFDSWKIPFDLEIVCIRDELKPKPERFCQTLFILTKTEFRYISWIIFPIFRKLLSFTASSLLLWHRTAIPSRPERWQTILWAELSYFYPAGSSRNGNCLSHTLAQNLPAQDSGSQRKCCLLFFTCFDQRQQYILILVLINNRRKIITILGLINDSNLFTILVLINDRNIFNSWILYTLLTCSCLTGTCLMCPLLLSTRSKCFLK